MPPLRLFPNAPLCNVLQNKYFVNDVLKLVTAPPVFQLISHLQDLWSPFAAAAGRPLAATVPTSSLIPSTGNQPAPAPAEADDTDTTQTSSTAARTSSLSSGHPKGRPPAAGANSRQPRSVLRHPPAAAAAAGGDDDEPSTPMPKLEIEGGSLYTGSALPGGRASHSSGSADASATAAERGPKGRPPTVPPLALFK